MNKQIKAIIFDVGRVLVNWDNAPFWDGLAAFSAYPAEEMRNRVRNSGAITDYHHGKISTQEFYSKVSEEIAASGLDFEIFCDLWNSIMTEPNEPIGKILDAIKSDIRLLILSDTTELHWELISKLALMKRFVADKKLAILSFEVGVSKPAEKIYQAAVKKAGCLFGECVFVDDVEENVEQFEALGGNAINYDCRIDAIGDLENRLAAYDVFE